MKLRSTATLILATCLLSACVSDDSASGDYYRFGFTDGCRTGEAQKASFSQKSYQNADLFKQEPSYRSGWRSGFTQCNSAGQTGKRPGDLGEQTPF